MARLVIGTSKTPATSAIIKEITPVIDALNVTPSTSEQTITAPSGTDGYSPVNVSAVTSSIDANIVAGNIKNGVSILGVEGTYTGSAPAHYIEKSVDANGKLINSSNSISMNGVTDVGYYCLYYAYSHNTSITTIDMSSLTSLTGENCMTYCFENCSALTGEINFSLLTVISGDYALNRCFSNCTNITMVNFPVLTTITGYYGLNNAFRNTNLTGSVYFPSLTILNAHTCMGECFSRCLNLTNLYFPSLTPTSFGTYTNIFNNMLSSVTGCTVHFPSNIQSTIGSWSSVTGGFGGTNTTVLFDLPATVTLTGADTVTYTRNPKYDTATALAWKVGAYGTTDFTPAYYTSGTTDPQANDTIYSDSACTTAVTTISSIA